MERKHEDVESTESLREKEAAVSDSLDQVGAELDSYRALEAGAQDMGGANRPSFAKEISGIEATQKDLRGAQDTLTKLIEVRERIGENGFGAGARQAIKDVFGSSPNDTDRLLIDYFAGASLDREAASAGLDRRIAVETGASYAAMAGTLLLPGPKFAPGGAKATQIGYHATRAEFAESILQTGFRESKAGRLGGSGVYVNNTSEGAIAEYFAHNPGGPTPTVLQVKYSSGLNYRIVQPPGGYTKGPLPLAADTLTTESLRLPGTFNTIIRNGTAMPLPLVP